MNQKPYIILLVLGMMTLMPGICFARSQRDSVVLNQVWSYRQNYIQSIQGVERNAYMVYEVESKRRNALLFLVPTMYSIAKGDKKFIGEAYCRLKFGNSIMDNDLDREIVCGTIPSNRRVMPAMFVLTTPDLYGEQIYHDRLLSPFHRSNRKFYSYQIHYENEHKAYLTFTPRMDNTQLVKGTAIVDVQTGCILYVTFDGEYDMINFRVMAEMNIKDPYGLPEVCHTKTTFKFMGNHIESSFSTYYNCQQEYTDTLSQASNREKMAALRPVTLTKRQQAIYDNYDTERQAAQEQQQQQDTTRNYVNAIAEKAWDNFGYHLINSTRASSDKSSIRISPLLNPLYMSYSNSKGISYKLSVDAAYRWNSHRFLTLDASLGYNTKKKQLYYTLPLRMTYNPKRNGYVELTWGNGNRTSSEAVSMEFAKRTNDSISIPEFKDEYLRLVNNISVFDWLEVTGGFIYRLRRSTKSELMTLAQMPDHYVSFAPIVTVHLSPWRNGPTLTANYEHSFKNIFRSSLEFERWEFDLAYKLDMKGMRFFNIRTGAGFYTHRNSSYFVYYNNFRDENLPSGWEDDWSGQFQLVNSSWYNISDYYLRGHMSYDSPLLLLTWLPWAGRFIETERIYLSALLIEHTRPYFEVGYGVKNRFFSSALFASFLNGNCDQVGFKFTFELFRRW